MIELDFNKTENAYKSFLLSTAKLVDIFNEADYKNRKVKYLPEWLEFYTQQLLEENNSSNSKRYAKYKRGTIIYVNLGSNIGKEFSGNHFCVVLDKKDNPNKETITVIPLSSKNSQHYVQLYSSIFDITIEKLNKEVEKLDKEVNDFEDMDNIIMNKHEDSIKEKAERVSMLYKYGYITSDYIDKSYKEVEKMIKDEANIFKEKISKLKKRAENIKIIEKVFDKHKNKQSYANISAITTISKKRIQKINDEDPTGKILIDEEDLRKIEKQIMIKFIKN